MSPEHATADRQIDGRSDVYSLACVVYEMLVGEPVFDGTDQNVMMKHAKQKPPRVRTLRPDLPPAVERGIHAALAKKRRKRPQTAGEFVGLLRG